MKATVLENIIAVTEQFLSVAVVAADEERASSKGEMSFVILSACGNSCAD